MTKQTIDGARGCAFRSLREFEGRYRLVHGIRELYDSAGPNIQKLLRSTNDRYITLCEGYLEKKENPSLTLRLGNASGIYVAGNDDSRIEINEGIFELPPYGQVNLGDLVICVNDFLAILAINAKEEIDRICIAKKTRK